MKWVVCTLTFWIASCTQPGIIHQTAKPDTLFTRQQMAYILADLHLAEALVSNDTSVSTSQHRNALYQTICTKYTVSLQTLSHNFMYYKEDLVEMDSVYVLVINRLSELEAVHTRIPNPAELSQSPVFHAIPQ